MRWHCSPSWILGSLILYLGGTAAAQEQVGSIRGLVIDKDFDAPLAVAQVLIVETGQKVTTSDQGNFVFGAVPPGKYTLVFSKDGYVRQVRADVVVSAGQLTDVNVALSGDFTEMEEFVVQDILALGGGAEAALLQLRLDSPALMDSISAELMSRAGASDAASALTLVSGASLKDGKSAVIRGLPDRYVSSQMNGVRLPTSDEDKRAVELDQFPAAVIESIQVTKTFTPDQQGDASGGAVDVRLKGIPNEPFFFNLRGQVGYNSQVGRRSDFLTYEGGGVSKWGIDDGRRDIQLDNLGGNWDGAVGVSRDDAPPIYKWAAATGGVLDLGRDVRLGGSLNFFYERDAAFYDNGKDYSYWVDDPGGPMVPQTEQGVPSDGDFKTLLFDISQGSESVQWGGLGTLGLETEYNSLDLAYLYTRTAEDKATLAEDTNGKRYFFPGYDPGNPTTPGHDRPEAAPYVRLQTLEYTERTTETLQLHGRHTLPIDDIGFFLHPEIDWTLAKSSASLDQPDKRQFGSEWRPTGAADADGEVPGLYRPFKPAANFTIGNLQRIWKDIEEESESYAVNFKMPFEQWSDSEGYVKLGVFSDEVDRKFNQDTFSNFGDNSSSPGPFTRLWSDSFPFEDHPITEALLDVDYTGEQNIFAWYAMMDLPVTPWLNLIGGARVESTEIGIVNDPEEEAVWFPPGSNVPTDLNPGDADVQFEQDDVLPALGLVLRPLEGVSFRASYSQTIARQTFKELTPILQQEFLGGPIFIGNPELGMSSLTNYDLRLDYTPYEGGLVSVSWFRKDIDDPIEYVQRIANFTYTTAVNYPEGRLDGWEFEVRQALGQFWDPLRGVSIGGNATLIDSRVTLPEDEQAGFRQPNIQAPMDSREMTNAPEYLVNLYLTYDIEQTGTRFGVFYTLTGDTLITGAAESGGNFVPNVYATGFDNLNISVAQRLSDWFQVQFRAKNVTNPDIQTVYRSPYIGADVLNTSFSEGIEYSLSIGGEIRF